MLQHITEGRLEGERISAAESLTVTAGPDPHFNWSGELKAQYPWSCGLVSHRVRGRRASVRRENLAAVISEDVALDRNLQEEFEVSGNEQTEVATDRVDFLLVVTCGWFAP